MLNLLKNKHSSTQPDQVYAAAEGRLIPAGEINDAVFSEQLMGQTVGIIPANGIITSPVSGTLEVMYPTGHAFAVRTKNGAGFLVHIGIDTVTLNGIGFEILKKQGDTVKAGDEIVNVDLSVLSTASIDPTVMIVETEPGKNGKVKFISPCEVTKDQIITES